MSKTHLFELSKEGFWRGATLQPATLAALQTRHALAVRVKATPIFEGNAAIVEPEQAAMRMRVAEMTVLERHVTGPEHEVAVAELEDQAALAELPELSWLEPWDMSELG